MVAKVSNIFLGNAYIAKLGPLSLTQSQEEIENDKIFYRPIKKTLDERGFTAYIDLITNKKYSTATEDYIILELIPFEKFYNSDSDRISVTELKDLIDGLNSTSETINNEILKRIISIKSNLDEYKLDMSIKNKIIQSLLSCSNNYVNELLYGYNEESISDYKSFIHAINKKYNSILDDIEAQIKEEISKIYPKPKQLLRELQIVKENLE